MNNIEQCDEKNGLLTFEERTHLAKTLPKDEKQTMVIKTYLRNTQYNMKEDGKCLDCAFLKTNCICDSLENLICTAATSSNSSSDKKTPPVIRFLVWMHYKEKYRASNTGKLLLKLFPGSKCFIHAVPDDYMEFSKIVRNNAASRMSGRALDEDENNITSDAITVVLYPSDDAVEATDLLQMMKQNNPERSNSDSNNLEENPLSSYKPLSHYQRIDIVILDGTWKQARRLRRKCTPASFGKTINKFDYVIPVKISPTELSRFSCRRQSRTDHISTIEAAATFINDLSSVLQQFETNNLLSSYVENMYSALELLCNTMDNQSHFYSMPYVKPTKNGLNRLPKHAHWSDR